MGWMVFRVSHPQQSNLHLPVKHNVAMFTAKSKVETTPVIMTATSSILIFYNKELKSHYFI